MNKRGIIIHLTNFPTLHQTGIYPRCEFHILASLRKKYQVEDYLFMSSGNVTFPNYHAVRLLAQKMNAQRDLQKNPKQTVYAGQLNAMGLIDEIYHYVLRLYEETVNPKVFERALKKLDHELQSDKLKATFYQFGTLFPPQEVYNGKITLDNYFKSGVEHKPNTELMLEEMILLYFANFNQAATIFKELFDDKDLKKRTKYTQLIIESEKFFQTEKQFGPHNQYIFDLLRSPILANPHSLEGQLEYIKTHWGLILGEKFLGKILSASDLMKEDVRLMFHGSPPTPPVPTYNSDEMKGVGLLDLERFTSDWDWMPNVVLLAKNIYVWLDQLSKKYERSITKLNEIPDEELDLLARWNFTALWLIGIWERSPASQKIKQWTGNPEAVSSAYSLYDYTIAADLGGEEAFQKLRHRAGQRGIRLAGDMVPNHMGIYSKWLIEQPDNFIQSNYLPFPNYKFTGGNLSDHPDVEIRIEDGYWNRSDAAVVFQRIVKSNGNIRYIYHGNDGTHMPWNDTAQLDFLKSEVRESVIQTILHVARKFSIIRFDAAMTLTKRHFQRLWYPQPGNGGDIPSRADYELSTQEFNKLFPNEFWREVVDRINQEQPDTLLLAEAFWLLEGYFVRTLGMHRVYNSAFMHMLMKEENAKYRELIRNTMHYNPEILKRYVNFMSNPDEETAIAQFGKDDKYFGVALMMVTLPGLPMFAHGQIEGYTEKYGMEFKRAYYNEEPNQYLVSRHEWEIIPLLGKRHLFSQVTNFEMFDFIDSHGRLNENVFAYSNKSGHERSIICYHNKYEETDGWIKNSVGRNIATTDNPNIVHCTIADALALSSQENVYYIFRDYKTNLEYIRSGRDMRERGLHIRLKAFQYHIFMDFMEVHDTTGEYKKLSFHLHGQGVKDIQEELWMIQLFPVHVKLYELINNEMLEIFHKTCLSNDEQLLHPEQIIGPIAKKYRLFVQQVKAVLHSPMDVEIIVEELKSKFRAIKRFNINSWHTYNENLTFIDFNNLNNSIILYTWILIDSLHHIEETNFVDKLRFSKATKDIFENFNFSHELIEKSVALIKLLTLDNFFMSHTKININEYFDNPDVQNYIQLNAYKGILYFSKERFEELVDWLFTISIIKESEISPVILQSRVNLFQRILLASEASGYQFERFQQAILSKG